VLQENDRVKDLNTFVQICDHNWYTKKLAAGNVFPHGGAGVPFAGSWHCSQESGTRTGRI
jgi:hypothetical protein